MGLTRKGIIDFLSFFGGTQTTLTQTIINSRLNNETFNAHPNNANIIAIFHAIEETFDDDASCVKLRE